MRAGSSPTSRIVHLATRAARRRPWGSRYAWLIIVALGAKDAIDSL